MRRDETLFFLGMTLPYLLGFLIVFAVMVAMGL